VTRSTVTATRVLAAASLLIGGGVHLRLYFDGYRDFPNHNLGYSFLANVAASVVVAVEIAAAVLLVALFGQKPVHTNGF
jgi:hypothetical protein